jgi:hypothetical protein
MATQAFVLLKLHCLIILMSCHVTFLLQYVVQLNENITNAVLISGETKIIKDRQTSTGGIKSELLK